MIDHMIDGPREAHSTLGTKISRHFDSHYDVTHLTDDMIGKHLLHIALLKSHEDPCRHGDDADPDNGCPQHIAQVPDWIVIRQKSTFSRHEETGQHPQHPESADFDHQTR